MSKQFLTRRSKKRSFSELSKNQSEVLWTSNFKSKTSFPAVSPQLLHVLAEREEVSVETIQKNTQLTRERTLMAHELVDQRTENEGLRRSIQETIDKVKVQRKESILTKDQLFVISEDKVKIEKEYRTIISRFQDLQDKHLTTEKEQQRIKGENEDLAFRLKGAELQLADTLRKSQGELRYLREENEKLTKVALDEGLAAQRIKVLEAQLRQIKLDKSCYEQSLAELSKKLSQSEEELRSVRPEWEKQADRIKYFERVVNDLQKKNDEFYRKEYQANREMDKLSKEMSRTEETKDGYRKMLEMEQNKLKSKVDQLQSLFLEHQEAVREIVTLREQNQQQRQSNLGLKGRIKELEEDAQKQGAQFALARDKMMFLEAHQLSVMAAIAQAKVVSEESNKFVHKRDIQAYKLKQDKEFLGKKVEDLVQRYRKFEEHYLESSLASKNKLKDSVVAYVRTCSKIQIDMNDVKKSLDAKDLEFMEEREMLKRDLEVKMDPIPTDIGLYHQVFLEKNQEIRLLENSNAQLLKTATGYDDVINTLEQQNYRLELESQELRRELAETKKLEREVVELRHKEKDQEVVIVDLKKENRNIEDRLLKKTDLLSSANGAIRHLQTELATQVTQNELLTQKITPTIKVIVPSPPPPSPPVPTQKQPIKIPEPKHISSDLKEIAMVDAVDKMSNALASMQLYFACGFCEKTVEQPHTVLPCGHHFCQDCRDGFKDDCYECSNKMPIEGVFRNTFLEGALPRFKFFCMVFESSRKLFGNGQQSAP